MTSDQTPPVGPSSSEPSASDPAGAVPSRERVVVHRAPKIWGFLGLGAIVGIIATLVLTLAFRPADGAATVTEDGTEFGLTQVFGFLLVFLIPLGAALGALVAIVLDRILSLRAVEVDVERIDVAGTDTAGPDQPTTLPAQPTTPNEDPARP